MTGRRDIHAAVQFTRGAIAHFEDTALDLLAQHGRETNPVEERKLADEYEGCWDLKEQLEELLRRAQR